MSATISKLSRFLFLISCLFLLTTSCQNDDDIPLTNSNLPIEETSLSINSERLSFNKIVRNDALIKNASLFMKS
jgi:hypothetical protein